MSPKCSFLVRGARVFDGTRFLPPGAVLVRDGQIAAVEQRLTPPSGVPVIEAVGSTLLPGLIDAHTHAFPGSLEQALAFGVTTELDMFADPAVVASLKQQAADRPGAMADLRSAGTGATVPGGHPSSLVARGYYRPFPTLSGPQEAPGFVDARRAEGSDYLKIIVEDGTTTGYQSSTLTPDTVRALIRAAHERGLLAVVHALTQEHALLAVDAGADGLAHLFLDQPPSEQFIDAAATAGIFVIPTLSVLAAITGHGRGPRIADDPRLGERLDGAARALLTMDFPSGPGARQDLTNAVEAVGQLHAAGVRLLAGTDASNPGTAHGASLHDELALLIQAGLRAAEALTAATAAPADIFGLTDRGRIVPGLRADLVLIHGDPSRDITTTRAITNVWRDGHPAAR